MSHVFLPHPHKVHDRPTTGALLKRIGLRIRRPAVPDVRRGGGYHRLGHHWAVCLAVVVVIDKVRIAYAGTGALLGLEGHVGSVLVDEAVSVVVNPVQRVFAFQKGLGHDGTVALGHRAVRVARRAVGVVVDAIDAVTGRLQERDGRHTDGIRAEVLVAHPVAVGHKGDVLKNVEEGNVVATVTAHAIGQPDRKANALQVFGAVVFDLVEQEDHIVDQDLRPGHVAGLDDQAQPTARGIGRVRPVGVQVAIVLVVACLEEEFLVGVEDVFAEKAVPRAAPARIVLVGQLIGPEGGPALRVVALRDAVFTSGRIDVALDGLEGPGVRTAKAVLAKVGHIDDVERLARIAAHVGLYLRTHPELGQRHINAARVLGPFVPEIARIARLGRLEPVRDRGADVVAVDVIAPTFQRIDAFFAGHMPSFDCLSTHHAPAGGSGQQD